MERGGVEPDASNVTLEAEMVYSREDGFVSAREPEKRGEKEILLEENLVGCQ